MNDATAAAEPAGGTGWPFPIVLAVLSLGFWAAAAIALAAVIRLMEGRPIAAAAAFGLEVGFVIAAPIAAHFGLSMRRSAVTVPFADRDTFLKALDPLMAEVRYRPVAAAGEAITYAPRTLIRPRVLEITVGVGPSAAVLQGPVNAIKVVRLRYGWVEKSKAARTDALAVEPDPPEPE